MNKVKKFWPFILISILVVIFFFPIFKGNIPFPGDLLVNSNPYKAQGFLGYAPGAYPNKAQGPDVITEIYPWRYFSISEFKNGSIPFWNPHNFSGNPQMADFQTGIFYPLNFLYFLLPFNISWTLIIMLQPLLAGIFMYLFLKKGIGLKDFPSFIGALSFGFSSYMTVWIEYGNIGNTFLWLPLALLFTKYFFNKLNAINLLGISFTLSIAILAGYIQGVFYIYALCFLYYLYLVFSVKGSFKKHKKNFLFLVSLLLPFLITSFQIFPTLELFSQSTRGAYALFQIEKNLAPLISLLTIFVPDFFGNPATRNYWIDGTYIERVMYPGSLILFFAFYAAIAKTKIIEKKFFIIVSVTSLIIATNFPLVKFFYLIPIPLISTTIPTRELSIFIFSLIVLGAVGLDHFLKTHEFKKILSYGYLGAFILGWGILFALSHFIPDLSANLKISIRNLIIPTILVGGTIFSLFIYRINKKAFLIVVTLLVVFDLFYFFHKITPFAPNEFTYPKTEVMAYLQKEAGINRFWGYGSAYISSNFQSVDMTYSPEGNDPLHVQRYGELLSSSVNGTLPHQLPRPDANIAPGYGADDLRDNYFRKRILDLLGVKYILHKQELKESFDNPDLTTFPDKDYKMVTSFYPWQIYENKNVLPRFYVTGDYVIAKNKVESLNFIYDRNLDLRKTLILEEEPSIKVDSNASGTAELISYKANDVIFRTNSDSNSLLFFSDNYYSGWSVKIDEKVGKVLISDYTFRAVAVPKGAHTVEFYYQPKSFNLGLGIASLGLIVLFLTLFYVKNNEEKI